MRRTTPLWTPYQPGGGDALSPLFGDAGHRVLVSLVLPSQHCDLVGAAEEPVQPHPDGLPTSKADQARCRRVRAALGGAKRGCKRSRRIAGLGPELSTKEDQDLLQDLLSMPEAVSAAAKPEKRCSWCKTCVSIVWRNGPDGSQTLCNGCGLQFKKGRTKEEARANVRENRGEWVALTNKTSSIAT